MKLRKQIALFAVLLASTALFAHVFIPHHHHVDNSGVCFAAVSGCAHQHEHDADQRFILAFENGCNHCGIEKCSATLLFTLSHSATLGLDLLPAITWMAVFESTVPEPGIEQTAVFNPTEPRLISQYVLENLPRRAPPVAV